MFKIIFEKVRVLISELLVKLSQIISTSKTNHYFLLSDSGTLKNMLGVDMKQTF